MTPTPIDQLRQPHPDQARIDSESVRLLRETVRRRLDRIPHQPKPPARTGARFPLSEA